MVMRSAGCGAATAPPTAASAAFGPAGARSSTGGPARHPTLPLAPSRGLLIVGDGLRQRHLQRGYGRRARRPDQHHPGGRRRIALACLHPRLVVARTLAGIHPPAPAFQLAPQAVDGVERSIRPELPPREEG